MNFLVDHNLRGHAVLLSGSILSGGWLDWLLIRFITFEEMSLPIDSDDRVVWRLAQSNQMILLTANRSMKGENSLFTSDARGNNFYIITRDYYWRCRSLVE